MIREMCIRDRAQAHVETRRVPGETGDLSFTAVLADPTNGTIIGFNNPATVTIADSCLLYTSRCV